MSRLESSPMGDRLQPDRAQVCGHERLTILEHPLCEHLLATVRDSRRNAGEFGDAAAQIASFLLWEATRDLRLRPATVTGFAGTPVEVRRLESSPTAVVILRAGELFAAPFRMLFPEAPIYHLGIARDETTLQHRVYSDSLPASSVETNTLLILDPMLATGGSIAATIERARAVYAGNIVVVTLVSAPLGVQVVLAADGRTRIVTAALDERLDGNGYILPGLGDAGDRFFGTGAR